jgi:hypothetical protein
VDLANRRAFSNGFCAPGRWQLAIVVEDPDIRCSAATRLQAEDGVKQRYLAKLNPEYSVPHRI